jgi:hypothetical protein
MVVTDPAGPTVDLATGYTRPVVWGFRDTPETTSLGAGFPTTYLTVGPFALVAGTYHLVTGYFVDVSAANSAYAFDLLQNGVPAPFGAAVEQLGLAAAQAPRAGNLVASFLVDVPSITVDLVFWKNSGSGSVTLENAFWAAYRIA